MELQWYATKSANATICAEADGSLATVVATDSVSNVLPLPLRSLLLFVRGFGYEAGRGLVRQGIGFPVAAAEQILETPILRKATGFDQKSLLLLAYGCFVVRNS